MPFFPPVPSGLTLSEFGERIWQSGPESAQKRIHEVTLEELKQLGLTFEMARQWRDFYIEQANRGRGLPTSRIRARLLDKCLDLLERPAET